MTATTATAAPINNQGAPVAPIFPLSIVLPDAGPDAKFVGIIISACGKKREAIFLLPGDSNDANWQAQMDWAASIGGELPDRVEGALLFAIMPDEFKSDWYWTREQRADDSGFAWVQDFGVGGQDWLSKSNGCRARAVRRLPI